MKRFCQCGRKIKGRHSQMLCEQCLIKIFNQRKKMNFINQVEDEPKEETPEEKPEEETPEEEEEEQQEV